MVHLYVIHPQHPLELHYLNWLKIIRRIIEKRGDNITPLKEIGGCININKKLTNVIREYLNEKGINNSSMYPDLRKLKTECIA